MSKYSDRDSAPNDINPNFVRYKNNEVIDEIVFGTFKLITNFNLNNQFIQFMKQIFVGK